jgi:hypothetical protein
VFLLNQVGAIVTATVSDLTSGEVLSPVNGSADTSSVGAKTIALTGQDKAGNQKTENCSYSVIFNFTGFFQPVDNLPTLNHVKAGSAIPVKFSLHGNQGLGIFAAGYPVSRVIYCDGSAPLDDIETVTAGNSSLTYDPGSDQYIYVWKTEKSWAGQCRQLNVKLADGTEHFANLKFK